MEDVSAEEGAGALAEEDEGVALVHAEEDADEDAPEEGVDALAPKGEGEASWN